VLYRLVTGKHTFETPHLIAYLGRLVLEEAPRASTLRPNIPVELDNLLSQALRRNATERPANAGELAALLGSLPALTNDTPDATAGAPSPMHACPCRRTWM